MKYNNKGQAALEFLMTYGWAILAAIIVIGALGSYFYFNQGGTDTAYMSAPFSALASSINSTGMQIEVQNKGGEDLRNVTLNVSGSSVFCTQVIDLTMSSSEAAEIVYITCNGLTSGGSFKGDTTMTYLRPGSSLAKTSTGSLSGPIAA